MTFRLVKSLRGYRPLTCIGDTMYLGQGNRVLRCDFDLRRLEPVCDLPLKERMPALIPRRLFDRILRRGIQTAFPLGLHHLLAVHRSNIWKIDLRDGSFELDFTIPGGRRVLKLSRLSDPEGAKLCFGEYFDNADRGLVNVWARPDAEEGQWRVTGCFPAHQIYHVHSIVQDPATGSVFVMTGDFGDEAGFWTTSTSLNRFTPLLRGRQEYRATWMWRSPFGRVFYATDTQFVGNALMEMQEASNVQVQALAEIEGSSIHAGHGESFTAFSSAVEPGQLSGIGLIDLLERQRGAGAKSDWARIYHLAANGELTVVFSAKKDAWPYRLAQFGTFTFPTGVLPDGVIVAYGVALQGVDDTCLVFKQMRETS